MKHKEALGFSVVSIMAWSKSKFSDNAVFVCIGTKWQNSEAIAEVNKSESSSQMLSFEASTASLWSELVLAVCVSKPVAAFGGREGLREDSVHYLVTGH